MKLVLVTILSAFASTSAPPLQAQSHPTPLLPTAPPPVAPTLTNVPSPEPLAPASLSVPPLPAGVAELSFHEFFKSPVGRRGLEVTDRLLQLDQQRVRIRGYMVRQSDPTPRLFLFAPRPVKLHEHEYGMADELPASTLHVFTATNAPPLVPFTPGPLLLTGRLSVGARQEPSGRISFVRLHLDAPPEPAPDALATAQRPSSAAVGRHTH